MTTVEIIATAGLVLTNGATLWALGNTKTKLSEARERIQENETDLANFAEYKRIAQSVKAKATKPRKAKA